MGSSVLYVPMTIWNRDTGKDTGNRYIAMATKLEIHCLESIQFVG